MQTKAEKYRIAADIEETGKEWEIKDPWGSGKWATPAVDLLYAVGLDRVEIRIKPEPEPVKLVPLGLADAQPGTVFRPKATDTGYRIPFQVCTDGVVILAAYGDDTPSLEARTWADLQDNGWEILRPGGEWQPCSKPA